MAPALPHPSQTRTRLSTSGRGILWPMARGTATSSTRREMLISFAPLLQLTGSGDAKTQIRRCLAASIAVGGTA